MRGYEESDLSRREYCRQIGIPVTTLDYYRQRRAKKKRKPTLVPVTVDAGVGCWPAPMILALVNGRRIEVSAGFVDEELARLVRVAEQA